MFKWHSMLRLWRLQFKCAFVLVAASCVIQTVAQTSAANTGRSNGVQTATVASNSKVTAAPNAGVGGIALKSSTNVKDYVNIQVVLLPREQAKRVFSKEIASRYAVMQVLIDNRSEDAAFVLHSIFADYAGWVLGGVPSASQVTSTLAITGTSSSPGGPCPQETDNVKGAAYQTVSCAGQVASIESRVIRGELQDASTWTVRNTLIRAAVLVGAVAAGIPAFGSKNALRYVGAYNGQFVPGMEVFLPDGTLTQINRVSDFGFQTNKVFAKGDSDPVYAFFPLDRFLTPGMKDIFLKAPAVFFAPAQIFVDKHVGNLQRQVDEMKDLIENLVFPPITPLCGKNKPITPCFTQKQRDQQMLRLLTTDCSVAKVGGTKNSNTATNDTTTGQTDGVNCNEAQAAQHLINQISLNSANILVQGVMTVNVAIVPATITDITFDDGNDSTQVWTELNQDHVATMTGSFLTGGVPGVTSIEVPNEPSAQIGDYLDPMKIVVVSDGSTDSKLNFKIQWKKQIPSGSKLHFQVTKYESKDTKKTSGVKSMEFVLPVNYVAKVSSSVDEPSISQVILDDGDKAATWKAGSTATGNIMGSSLASAIPEVVKFTFKNDTGADLSQYIGTVKLDTSKTNDGSNLHVTLKLKKDVQSGGVIAFRVTKKAAGGETGQTVESNTKDYFVNYK